jgi:nitroreductase
VSQTRDQETEPAAPTADRHAALVSAVEIARAAPSVHNTQPWRWRLGDGSWLQLRADRRRRLPVADPDGRLLTQSCGAALHHARLALAAGGWQATVDRLPDPGDADLLATVRLGGPQEPDPQAAALLSAASMRRTDRRPVTDRPIEPEAADAIRAAAEGEGAHLHLIRREDVVELTVAMSEADRTELSETEHRAEIAAWIGGDRPDRTGVPSNAIPEQPPQTRVQMRYFGPPGTLPSDGGHDANATYAILHGETDTAQAWLQAGEALSACWLTATRHGLSVLPITAVVEILSTRLVLTRMLSGLGHPYLAMRLGYPDPAVHLPPATPRLPTTDIIEEVNESP